MITYLVYASGIAGLLLFLATSVGVIRFPDFYTRMHAAGKGDTLSTVLLLMSALLWTIEYGHGFSFLLAIKICLVILFVFIGSPTATHALMDAAYSVDQKKVPND